MAISFFHAVCYGMTLKRFLVRAPDSDCSGFRTPKKLIETLPCKPFQLSSLLQNVFEKHFAATKLLLCATVCKMNDDDLLGATAAVSFMNQQCIFSVSSHVGFIFHLCDNALIYVLQGVSTLARNFYCDEVVKCSTLLCCIHLESSSSRRNTCSVGIISHEVSYLKCSCDRMHKQSDTDGLSIGSS